MFRATKFACLGMLALALVMGLATPALALETRGSIAMLDADNQWFTFVDEANNVFTIQFALGGQVYVNGQALTLWDLQPGDLINMTYNFDAAGKITATLIRCVRT